MIPEKILHEKGGILHKYLKHQVIFYEGNAAIMYYQIIEGSIKIISTHQNGKEFIQAIYNKGQSFGVPALLTGKPYPVTSLANEPVTLIALPREKFLEILKIYPKINLEFIKNLGLIIYNYSLIAKAIVEKNPEFKILTILNIEKSRNEAEIPDKINLTRQQIADMTGLRVETVIRVIKRMEKKCILTIQKGKIYI